MTTESAPAPRAAQATAVQRAVYAIRPPRSGGGRSAAPAVPGRRHRAAPAALMAADCLALGLATALLAPWPWPPAVVLLQAAVQLLLNSWRGLFRTGLSPSVLTELPALSGLALVQWYATAEVLAACGSRYAVGWAALAFAAAAQTLLCCAGRAVVHRARSRAAARRPRSTLIVGSGPLADRVSAVLQEHPRFGMRPVGRVGTAAGEIPAPASGTALPVLASVQEAGRAVIQNSVRHAVFTVPPESVPDGEELFALFARQGCQVWLITDQGTAGRFRSTARPDHLWGFAAHPLHTRPHRPVAQRVKRVMDAALAAVALVLASPVMAACAIAVHLCDGPGVIFRQERVGRDGRPFVLLKFRTLRPADAQESATRWNVSTDTRMSRVGRTLRRTSLDELPQLWNVVRGDMSLVGPRPERPYFVQQFSLAHPGYRNRHRMPVGITGLAQVHGLRGDTSIEDRARFDNRYIDTWSLWQDVCVLARTAGSVFRLGGS
ncbi:exopolysaccharide biosynthesis polyprenyl glycosylphosphotransferase [Streptomyces sp. NBC_00059]|uniref:exopolysaccharide biosynthesis polyprenyl glycosylphosphotransferase n=1 Tax=Streptomyces sp. NBC_00059 TaxID=2975635 RepID=UPI00225AF683|nr:exopolysaccharide biosynthesis polyprenyl glycosylphosphotransferase [Streptomyces sp. NBC_00059]MCX5414717.1 exopolysaccharide biosynthesis polyprenyl glycosylphosphotransferase [Streptomyces sp. NBC_00059]